MANDVDVYVRERVPPAYREVVALVRQLMHDYAPQAEESVSYGMITWNIGKPIAWINPGSSHVTFSFREGVNFNDQYGLLHGSGKTARGVRLTSTEAVNQAALCDYINQAVERA